MITFEIKQESEVKGFSNTYVCEFRGNEVSDVEFDHFIHQDCSSGTLYYRKKTEKVCKLIRLFKHFGKKGYFEIEELKTSEIKEINEQCDENYIGGARIWMKNDQKTARIYTTYEGKTNNLDVVIRVEEGK